MQGRVDLPESRGLIGLAAVADQEMPQYVRTDLRRGRASSRRLNLVNHTHLNAVRTAQTERHAGHTD